jgi:hypothetical protein
LGIAEIDQDPVAHVLCYEAAEALHDVRDAILVGGNEFAKVFGVQARAESAVEPTRSENITVT